MMVSRIDQINICLKAIEDVTVVSQFEYENEGVVIKGTVRVKEGGIVLPFDIRIFPQYPFQLQETETIKFINKDLMKYDHVMGDGAICVHTFHNPKIAEKLQIDFSALKQWIRKYYINKESDNHYEHLITPQVAYKGANLHFLFTDVNYQFKKNEFGFFKYSLLSTGSHLDKQQHTFIVQEFQLGKVKIQCNWSANYLNLKGGDGIFIYVEEAPSENKRFIIKSWSDLEPLVDQRFMTFLYENHKKADKTATQIPIPVFIGYKIPTNKIHWQCAAIDLNNIPIHGVKITGTKNYEGRFYENPIHWLQTKNCSYEYFFGRGALSEKFTNRKILIIGVGAIGSMVATTLTRGGCKSIALADYDIKEPENVCRAEYFFATGINSKVKDLQQTLVQISPFVNIEMFDALTDGIKGVIQSGSHDDMIKDKIEEYDIVIDCSADNDLACILNGMTLKSEIINLSITNHAKELVCVFKPDLYKWINQIYSTLDNGTADLYNPTGCWSPTFKASYNDIALMVQFAIKQINSFFIEEKFLRNFYLQVENNNGINIKQYQF